MRIGMVKMILRSRMGAGMLGRGEGVERERVSQEKGEEGSGLGRRKERSLLWDSYGKGVTSLVESTLHEYKSLLRWAAMRLVGTNSIGVDVVHADLTMSYPLYTHHLSPPSNLSLTTCMQPPMIYLSVFLSPKSIPPLRTDKRSTQKGLNK